jgi:hypothetical protein
MIPAGFSAVLKLYRAHCFRETTKRALPAAGARIRRLPMAYEHPFKEYHEDAAIGNLMWRIDRRSDAASDSQDGLQINDIEQKISNDQAELAALLAAYKEGKR